MKNYTIIIRVSEKEKKLIQELATSEQMNISEYIRQILHDQKKRN